MSGGSITSRPKGEVLPLGMSIVFPDRVNVRTSHRADAERLRVWEGYQGVFDAEGKVYGESSREGNVYVRVSPSGTLFSGSLRNWADSRGPVPFSTPFGPEATGRTLDALGDAAGLPSGALRAAQLTMVEGTVDLAVPRPAGDYVRACEDVPRMKPARWGDETVTHSTARRQLKVYDRPDKLRSEGRPVPGPYLEVERSGRHVVRFEYTLRSGGAARSLSAWSDGDDVVRAGLLVDPTFRRYLTRLVIGQARRLRFGRVPVPAASGLTPGQRRKWEAIRGIEASGGRDAALDAVRAEKKAGHLEPEQAKYQLRRVRELYRDPAYTDVADLQTEFEAALDATYGFTS